MNPNVLSEYHLKLLHTIERTTEKKTPLDSSSYREHSQNRLYAFFFKSDGEL